MDKAIFTEFLDGAGSGQDAAISLCSPVTLSHVLTELSDGLFAGKFAFVSP